MGETSGEIERHIQETRNDLGDNFNELEEKVKTAVDWRAQFEARPMTMMAMAFSGGILLSALLPTGHSSRRRYPEAPGTAPPERDVSTAFDGKANEPLQTWDALKGALVGVAATKLSGFIDDLLPGFKQEFTKAQSGAKKQLERVDSSPSGQPSWQKSAAAGAD
jgi:hypothetical protein